MRTDHSPAGNPCGRPPERDQQKRGSPTQEVMICCEIEPLIAQHVAQLPVAAERAQRAWSVLLGAVARAR